MTTVLTEPAPGLRADIGFGTKVVAVVACAAIGLRVDLVKGVTPGIVVLVLLAPVWWPQVRNSKLVASLVALTGLAVVVGLVLAWTVRQERAVDWRVASAVVSLVALSFAGMVVLLWARTVISVSAVVASLMVGVLLYELSTPRAWTADPWKFAFARPVGVLALLAVAWSARRLGRQRPVLSIVVLLVLAGIAVFFDYRSESGFLVLVIVLVAWQALAVGQGRRLKALSPALLLVTVAGAVYLGATQLFVSGALGTAIQERSTQQVDASGSLLLGGRPEWSASVQLIGARPGGYGFGVLADSTDVQLAENGFVSIHADPATGYEGYITQYMLAGGFHLHSVAADIWSVSGFAGFLLAGLVVGTTVWGLSSSLAVGRAEPVLIYASIVVLWDIAFSPLQSSSSELVLGLFLAVVSIQHVTAVRRAPRAVDLDAPPGGRPAARLAAPRVGVLYGAAAAAPEPNGGSRGTV